MDLDPQDAPYRRRRVFPFRWLEPMPAAQLRESESFLAVSAGLEDIGLSQSDARTLSQTVLTELVENVAKHGGVGGRKAVALVGAILVAAETYALRQNGMHPHLTEVAERALANAGRDRVGVLCGRHDDLPHAPADGGVPGGQSAKARGSALGLAGILVNGSICLALFILLFISTLTQ